MNRAILPLRAALAALLLACIAAVAAQAPLPASMSPVQVTSSSRHDFSLQPGDTGTYELTVANQGDVPTVVNVTRVDFTPDPWGGVVLDDAAGGRSNGAWLEVASSVDVPAHSSVAIPVTFRAPDDVPDGTYWSVLFVEPDDPAVVDQDGDDGGVHTSISVSVRFGVTLLTHVGEPDDRNLTFAEPSFNHEGGASGSSLHVTVENSTRFLTTANVWLELYDDQGALAERIAAGDVRIYPEAGRRQTFDLGTLPDGAYQAVVIADAGDDAVFGVRYDLDATTD